MAMTFSSKGCIDAANQLRNSAKNLDRILNTDLTTTINSTKEVYRSETADELYAFFDKMKAKFPDFIQAINSCSNYLSNTVAPAYEKLEATATSKIQ